MAEYYEETTRPGYGVFFDFETTPELKQLLLDYLIKIFGWAQEAREVKKLGLTRLWLLVLYKKRFYWLIEKQEEKQYT